MRPLNPQEETSKPLLQRVPLTESLEIKLKDLQDSVKRKQEWIVFLKGNLAKEETDLQAMIDGCAELESSIHILKHIQGRPF